MHYPSFCKFLVFAVIIAGTIVPAQAEQKPDPISATVTLELQNDWNFKSDDPAEERNDTFATIEAAITATLAPRIALKSLFVFEPVLDPGPGEDRFFEDLGLYVEEVYGTYDDGALVLRIGKFGQKFGIAWDRTPGIWGGDLADYEISEQIGIAAELRIGDRQSGTHSLTFGTFFADTTALSDSAFASRGRLRKSDGGAGNTEDFSSFSIAVDGAEVPSLPGFAYHLGYLYRDSEGSGEHAETGFAIGVTQEFALAPMTLALLLEWARLADFKGTAQTDAEFLTTAAEMRRGPWSLVLSWTGQETRAPGTGDNDDSQTEISLGYTFENKVKLSGGWRHLDTAGIVTETLGLFLEYEFGL
ncbi:MAG: hypothetical protein R3229_00630 [Alphaproteobacteria bacterium]|nr:hypothetical protein [Alphaproteobacteria bacterium]